MAQVQWDSNPVIGGQNPGDANYSPMWRISFIEWKDPSTSKNFGKPK